MAIARQRFVALAQSVFRKPGVDLAAAWRNVCAQLQEKELNPLWAS
jgi:hypothetical protein